MTLDYLAGFIDGEGSISLARGGSYRYRGVARKPSYRPMLSVTNTNLEVLQRARALMGVGSISERRKAATHHKQCWVLSASGLGLAALASEMIGRSIVKRRQWEILARFCARRREQKTRPFEAEDYEAVKEMRLANARPAGKGTEISVLPSVQQQHKWWGVR